MVSNINLHPYNVAGYAIGPHTDSEAKWVTTLFYLPKTNILKGAGGTLVGKFRDGKQQKEGSKWEGFGGYNVVKRAPFTPNSVFAFAPCYTSWHAVAPLAMKGAVRRDTIQAFISTKSPKVNKERCG